MSLVSHSLSVLIGGPRRFAAAVRDFGHSRDGQTWMIAYNMADPRRDCVRKGLQCVRQYRPK